MRAAAHPRQDERLAALRSFDILDTPRQREFDEVVELISQICDVPIAVINLIDQDRQWFKAEVGLGIRETPLESSICSHVILVPGLTIISDTLSDSRLSGNPLCISYPNIRFYAGMCLETEDGLPIGTLCALDTRPRQLSDLQQTAISVLGRQVMRQIQLAKSLKQATILRQEVDHRVKNSLSVVMSMLSMQARQSSGGDVADALLAASRRVAAMVEVHDQLQHATHSNSVEARSFFEGLMSALSATAATGTHVAIAVPKVSLAAKVAVSLGIIINELFSNAIKHGANDRPLSVQVSGRIADGRLEMAVSDNGRGLPQDFDPTARSGLGMKVCLALVRSVGGQLTWSGRPDGSTFHFSAPIEI